ncbi:hypothetical protein [Nocardia sp. NPDC050175]|uniref:hypothetical protein n=1 Tax=Nocardia sp. NPDC050175 TaxID=3364317 RepID=UPI003788A776
MTALIATGIATQHGPSPENQAAILTATMTELPPLAPATEPAITTTDTQQQVAAGQPDRPIHAVRPATDSGARPDRQDQSSSDKVGPTGLGLPLTPFDPKTEVPGRTNAPKPHHQSDARETARPGAQTALPPIDFTALLTNISAALNAGAAFAEGLQSGSAGLNTSASTPAAPSSTDADATAPASTPANNVQMAAPTADLTSLLTTISSALKVGAALADGLESGSSVLGPGSAALGPGSAALGPGSAALGPGSAALSPGSAALSSGSATLDGGSSIAGTGSSVLGPLAAILAPLSAAALASA